MDAAVHKVLLEEVIKLLLFCRGQGEHLGAREFSLRCEINGMVPCLPWWELIKGFLREDISEVMVLGWHHVLKGLAFPSLLSWDTLWADPVHSDDCYHPPIPPLF